MTTARNTARRAPPAATADIRYRSLLEDILVTILVMLIVTAVWAVVFLAAIESL